MEEEQLQWTEKQKQLLYDAIEYDSTADTRPVKPSAPKDVNHKYLFILF